MAGRPVNSTSIGSWLDRLLRSRGLLLEDLSYKFKKKMIAKVTYTDVVPYIEALKEFGRIAVIAAIPILIDGLSAGVINWQLVISAALIAVLRGVDKYAHLETKSGSTDIVSKLKLPF